MAAEPLPATTIEIFLKIFNNKLKMEENSISSGIVVDSSINHTTFAEPALPQSRSENIKYPRREQTEIDVTYIDSSDGKRRNMKLVLTRSFSD